MKRRLLVACLIATSTCSFASADASVPTGNPKTTQKSYAQPATQVSRAIVADGKLDPVPAPGDDAGDQVGSRGVRPRPRAGPATNQQTGTGLGAPAPAGRILGVAAQAPPPEDECTTPLVVTLVSGSNTTWFDLTNCTQDAGNLGQTSATFGHDSGGTESATVRYKNLNDIWITFTAPWSHWVTIRTCGLTTVDTKLALYDGTGCPTAAPLTGNDNEALCSPQSRILDFWMTAGNNYTIALGCSPLSGNMTLPGPGGVDIETFPPFNDDCTTPEIITPVSGSNLFPFDNTFATTGVQGQTSATFGCSDPTYGNYRDVWYEFTAPWNGTATLTTCAQTTVDTKLTVWVGSGCPVATPYACNDDDVSCTPQSTILNMAVVANTNYTIQLGSAVLLWHGSSQVGGGQIIGPGNLQIDLSPTTPPTEDECSGAIAVVLGSNPYDNTSCTTGTQGQSETLCGRESGSSIEQDIWFTWTAPANPALTAFSGRGWAQVTTCGLATDNTKIAVYAGAGCPTGFALACRDQSCGTGQTTVIFPVVVGSTYTIQVGNPPSAAPVLGGVFDISYIPHPAPCAPWDDGTLNVIYGWFGPHDYAWMNRFGDVNQTVTITSVDIAYGVSFIGAGGATGFGIPDGSPTDVWVWQDGMSQDGDPSDAILLLSDPQVTANSGTDILNNFVLSTPITVTGYFFVGTHVYQPVGIVHGVSGYTVPFDTTFHDWENTSWNFRSDLVNATPAVTLLDPVTLTNNDVPVRSAESMGAFGQSPIRVNCSFGPTNSFCQPGFGLTLACPCGNQPTGLDRGCNNREGVVGNTGARLAATGTASLAAPLATSLVFHASDLPFPGSPQGILMQGKVLTNGKQFGHGTVCFNAFKRLYNRNTAPWASTSGGKILWDAPISPDQTIPVRAAAASDPIASGTPRFYQVYYRDNAGGFGLGPCEAIAGGGTNNSARQNITDGEWCFWGP